MKIFLFAAILAFIANRASGQWMEVYPSPQTITSYSEIGPLLFSIGDDGKGNNIFRSDDSGYTWNPIQHASFPFSHYLASFDSILFAGQYDNYNTPSEVAISLDSGRSWQFVDSMASFKQIGPISSHNGTFYAGVVMSGFSNPSFLILSTDLGHHWTEANVDPTFGTASSFAFHNNYTFVATSGGLWRSSDNGLRWDHLLPSEQSATAVGVNADNVFAATINSIWRSTNDGSTWTDIGASIRGWLYTVTNIISDRGIVFITFSNSNIHPVLSSSNNGDSWVPADDGLNISNPPDIQAMQVFGNYIIMGTNGQEIWRRPISDLASVSIENSEAKLAQVWPNPSSQKISLLLPAGYSGSAHIEIEDVSGRIIREFDKPILDTPLTLDLSGLSTGAYQCRIELERLNDVQRFLILR